MLLSIAVMVNVLELSVIQVADCRIHAAGSKMSPFSAILDLPQSALLVLSAYPVLSHCSSGCFITVHDNLVDSISVIPSLCLLIGILEALKMNLMRPEARER